MKHKVSELSGTELDYAVAKVVRRRYDYNIGRYHPTVDWSDCGPLISEFKIDHISRSSGICEVSTENEVYAWGSNELEAICRVVVKTVCGDEVEL